MENFESFNSQYGEVEIAYQDSKVVVSFTEEQRSELGQAEAEQIMQEYVDSLGENVEVGDASEYVEGYWTAQVFDAE
jgi:hypothetical protein